MEAINAIIAQVGSGFVPDKQVAIWKIEAIIKDGQTVLEGETNVPEAKAALLDTLRAQGQVGYVDAIQILPAPNLGDMNYGIVCLSVANMRSQPKHAAELDSQALLGTVIKVYKSVEDKWFLVQTPDGNIAWMDADAFYRCSEAAADAWRRVDQVIVTADYGFAHETPDTQSPRVSDLVKGNRLQLLGQNETSYHVRYPDGRKAYIQRALAMSLPEQQLAHQLEPTAILASAQACMGIPYLWGGTSMKAMDCSGFVQIVFNFHGHLLPRNSPQMARAGQAVDTSQGFDVLQPCDLLFFGDVPTKVTHVAIYMGNGQYIHAAGRVQTNSLVPTASNFNAYRLATFIGARRVLGLGQTY